MPRPSRKELIALAKENPGAIADRFLAQWDRVEHLENRIAELERNSRTSSKPPSTDKGNFTKPRKTKSTRKKSGKKPGGQKGHRGSTLDRVANPDHIEHHDFSPGTTCSGCGTALMPSSGADFENFQARQVHDLPPIKIEVTEHRARKCTCPGCGRNHVAPFPEGVNAPVQYGPNTRATAIYLANYQLVPYERLSEIFEELFGCPLSQGTLANFVKKGGKKAALAMDPIRRALLESAVAHADETSCTVYGKRHWLHVFCTDRFTCYHLDAKRGRAAMERMGLIPEFENLLIHDGLSAYATFTQCLHGPCHAHHQRELTFLHEELDQEWAGELNELLLEAKDLAERECKREEGSRRVIGEGRLNRIIDRYHHILEKDIKSTPNLPPNRRDRKAGSSEEKLSTCWTGSVEIGKRSWDFFSIPGSIRMTTIRRSGICVQ